VLKVAALVVLLPVLAAACTGSSGKAKPKPTAPPPPSSPTTVLNLLTVPGNPRTSTSLSTDINGGGATLVGTVAGPDGPVDATVRVERLIGDQVTSTEVKATAGAWQLGSVQGGRYRVRAWKPPDMAQLDPEVFFLGATETKQITLTLTRFGDTSVIGSTDPSPLVAGQGGNLLTQVVSGTVDPDGFVRASPRPGLPVQLLPSGGITLDGPDKQVSDGEGRNGWRVTCAAPGVPAVSLVVGTTRYPVTLPACAAAG
jgi:hypothetical protein